MSSLVTVKTGGVLVGRRNRAFDLDVTTVVLDLVRRGYRVYIRGEGAQQHHVVMLRMHQDHLDMEWKIGDSDPTRELLARHGKPDWWTTLPLHLSRLLQPADLADMTTNYPLIREEAQCPTP